MSGSLLDRVGSPEPDAPRNAGHGSRSYLAKRAPVRKLEDLREHFVVRADEAMAEMPFERLVERHCDPAKVAFRSNSFFARFAAIRDGIGLFRPVQKDLTRSAFIVDPGRPEKSAR